MKICHSKKLHRFLLPIFCAAVAAVICGCASTESENASARPWNSPKGWEHGLPGMLNEGR